MYFLSEDGVLVCAHELGIVNHKPTQDLVTIAHRRVLVATNPESQTIVGCPNIGPTIKPCTTTLAVKQGYSDLVRIQGKQVCLDTVIGLTDGTPPGIVEYHVRRAGQDLVREGT
ncbi:hypothetical protein EYB53_011295 [Candidatus Chloroploca sp. M-50]|uniref:Uncharacterized protein n=1 Tax=Candidatus Chloroploca mongolica TaxID=2528176 RepID=A0ABS4DA17_9CHLR|nr:hypothetical protein [Candidatus Chloroploca mongolica]MBP1466291.1 hypothetical protein [Candidatus Chloroploca mongolica]